MNYEDFSPEAKAGIEQFRKFVYAKEHEMFKIDNKILKFSWIKATHMVNAVCVLNGASWYEAIYAQEFAESKNYWLD